jgi:hypothetical protein
VSLVLKCDWCGKIENQNEAVNWLKVDYDGAYTIEFTGSTLRLPLSFCRIKCLVAKMIEYPLH